MSIQELCAEVCRDDVRIQSDMLTVVQQGTSPRILVMWVLKAPCSVNDSLTDF
jgi:hypothetical protein